MLQSEFERRRASRLATEIYVEAFERFGETLRKRAAEDSVIAAWLVLPDMTYHVAMDAQASGRTVVNYRATTINRRVVVDEVEEFEPGSAIYGKARDLVRLTGAHGDVALWLQQAPPELKMYKVNGDGLIDVLLDVDAVAT